MQPLIVPGVLDSLGAIANYVKEVAAAANLDKKATYRLRLAADEIATNIITYGYEKAGLEGVLCIQATLDERSLTVVIEDEAAPFDPLSRLPQALEMMQRPIAEQTYNGRGIFLVLESVDEFRYERAGDRNRNIFVMHRPLAQGEQEQKK